MTGKEAYKELVEKLGDMLSQCEADDINPFLVVIYQNINQLEEKDKELYKYKRAFEILKDYSNLPALEKFVYEEDGNYYAARIEEYDNDSEIPVTYHYLLDKEEYELLEELMNCGTKDN